ncbi:MAG: uroporphyrinogen-III synthase [Steroidobacteraceae bacterium]|jgi:uroporphyrinogen-III synthase
MRALQGVGVLVTRPEHQALPLCHLLEAQGATTQRLPALEIEALGEPAQHRSRVPERIDLIIVVSANAVRFGAHLLAQGQTALAAIGPATARALAQAGHDATILPGEGSDSEALLAHPGLGQLAGRRVLLVKGHGGRDLLARQLTARGAEVHAVDVYRRVRALPPAGRLEELQGRLRAGDLQVITATSLEIAENLLALAGPALRAEFEKLQWLVPGPRVAHGVRELGLRAPLVQAGSARDQDLVAALLRWRSSTSGA